MNEDDRERAEKLHRIKAALREQSEPKARRSRQAPRQSQSQSMGDVAISGNYNVVGNIINFTPKPARPRVVVQPDDGAITSAQAAKLQALVKDIVELETKVKRSPSSFQKVWGALNRKMGVAGYREIPSGRFELARKYLQEWIGRLHSAPSAPVKDGDNWRKRHYGYIKINSKSPEDAAALDAYMARNFKATSLTELSNDELDRVYRYVAGRRNRKR